jgi:phosphoglycerate dehydrogenase-like enzyme
VVTSAIHLNSRSVAEFVVGLILMALKNVFPVHRDIQSSGRSAWLAHDKTKLPGYYHTRVGLLGYGHVAREVAALLGHFDFDLYLSDPYASAAQAEDLGARLASEDELMATCDVVSLHHADIPANRGMINRENLRLLKPGATFINTARGALVNEEDLAERLQQGDITAFLDVTYPEPPAEDSLLYRLPNCILTPHIAGATGSEVNRFGEYVVREVRNWIAGRPLENPVDLKMVSAGA